MVSIPHMMARITHVQNRKSLIFSVFLGVFAPLTALLMMHFGGQGRWDDMSAVGWLGRFVALCCVVVSTPKVYRFFVKATEGHRVEAIAATLAVEVAALMAMSKVVGLYAFAIQVVLNILVYSNSIAADAKASREVRPRKQVPVVHSKAPKSKRKGAKKGRK